MIIASLENNLRGDGFSLCNSLLNLLGSFPPSYVFGALLDLFEKKMTQEEIDNKKHYNYTMITGMAYNFVGLIFIIIAGVFRFKIKGDLSSNPDEEIKKAENLGIEEKDE